MKMPIYEHSKGWRISQEDDSNDKFYDRPGLPGDDYPETRTHSQSFAGESSKDWDSLCSDGISVYEAIYYRLSKQIYATGGWWNL